jgi:hypothetical protein
MGSGMECDGCGRLDKCVCDDVEYQAEKKRNERERRIEWLENDRIRLMKELNKAHGKSVKTEQKKRELRESDAALREAIVRNGYLKREVAELKAQLEVYKIKEEHDKKGMQSALKTFEEIREINSEFYKLDHPEYDAELYKSRNGDGDQPRTFAEQEDMGEL